MNILAIGNSFTVDANRYLYEIARKDGVEINVATLYISGCTLDMHFRNMLSEKPAYALYYNGLNTKFDVSIKEALLNRAWDIVTIQQGSHMSFCADSYHPYGEELVSYVRKMAPKAKIIVHQTWAYEQDSKKLLGVGYTDHKDMFADLQAAYQMLCRRVDAVGIIPSGQLFQQLLANGFETVHRDTYHATRGAGRYALGLLWYRMLTGADVTGNSFCDFDEEVTAQQMQTIKTLVQAFRPLDMK
ncbi:MAG: DUF4886 domain-containing protein [Oscillospiraceae bacterium]|nr:DUF4886 domain-containing protein [Oscillospiraceae bacterium]